MLSGRLKGRKEGRKGRRKEGKERRQEEGLPMPSNTVSALPCHFLHNEITPLACCLGGGVLQTPFPSQTKPEHPPITTRRTAITQVHKKKPRPASPSGPFISNVILRAFYEHSCLSLPPPLRFHGSAHDLHEGLHPSTSTGLKLASKAIPHVRHVQGAKIEVKQQSDKQLAL